MARFCTVALAVLCSLVVANSALATNLSHGHVTLAVARHARIEALVTFKGRITGTATRSVAIERLERGRWTSIATGRADPRGRFSLTWIARKPAGLARLRAVAGLGSHVGAASQVRSLVLRPHRGSAVTVSAKTQILAPTEVSTTPAPGKAGTLTYSGGNAVNVGQIVAIAASPQVPDGFLGEVTSVTTTGGQTVAQTRPASLLEAVPEASVDEEIPAPAAQLRRSATRALKAAAESAITCQGSASATVTPNVSFSTSLHLSGHWSILHGLQSVALTAGANAQASLAVDVQGSGSCSLTPVTVFQFPGPSAGFFVGPVPVYIASEIKVKVEASVTVDATSHASVGGGFSATAGLEWNKGKGFAPIENFTPSFTYTAPTLSANAEVTAAVTPTIDVLLYGVAGPELSLQAGLDLKADTSSDPWWTLSAPVEVDGKLTIPQLGISSPSLHIYSHSFKLADAGGPFGPAVTFDGSPGTDSPPSTLGPFTMLPFGTDPSDEGTETTQVDGPTGSIGFDSPLIHDLVGSYWATWSNGYTGDVYEQDNSDLDGNYNVTITLPPDTGAFYLYAEPNIFDDFSITATSNDSTTSGATNVYGDSGAQYFGFYARCGTTISSITVSDTGGDSALAVGEFGIAQAC